MLAINLRDLAEVEQARIWDSDEYVAEEKLNGVRCLCHIGSDMNRLSTRVKSKVTGLYSEKTNHFPHLRGMPMGFLSGTVLDGELLLDKARMFTGTTWAQGSLACTMALCSASTENAVALQTKEGNAVFWAFDIIRHRGEPIQQLPFSLRRHRLEEVFREIDSHSIRHETLQLVPQVATDKHRFYEELLAREREGVMLKHRDGLYQHTGRSKEMLKAKRFLTVDGFIIGSTPGYKGNAGLIGSLMIGVYDAATGKVCEIAGVAPYDLSRDTHGTNLRRAMTVLRDGQPQLAATFNKRVVEIEAFCWNKNNRLVHAKIARFRSDKTPEECVVDFAEITPSE